MDPSSRSLHLPFPPPPPCCFFSFLSWVGKRSKKIVSVDACAKHGRTIPSWPSPQKKSGFPAPPPFVAKVRRTRAREFKNYSLNPCAPLFSNFSYDDFLLDQFRLELASRGVVTEASSARFSFSTAQRKWNAAADHHATAPRRADLALAQLSATSVFENAAKTERGRRMALRRVRFRAITRGDVAFRRRRCDSHSSRIFHLRARPLDVI